MRIDVGKSGHDAMGAHGQDAIDHDLRAGHAEEAGILLHIVQHVAQIAIVATRVLKSGNGAFPGQGHSGLALELQPNTDRKVVGNDR